MNTKNFLTFSILIFLFTLLGSCSSEDRFVICGVSEYDCDYQHRIPGIITVTKGSSRKHYILTENGMKKAEITEGEPIAYNPKTRTALVKEVTDSSIDIFAADTASGEKISSEIEIKPKRTEKYGMPFLAIPSLLSSCIQDDGTIILLLKYDKLEFNDSNTAAENRKVLHVYEKGEKKKLKKYFFPNEFTHKAKTHSVRNYFPEEPQHLQCRGKNIYLFSEKNHATDISLFYRSQPNWILNRIDFDPEKESVNIGYPALIVYDNISFNYYSEKENSVYTAVQSSEKDKALLRITDLNEGYELPEEPIEKEDGEFLFSETPDGKPLIFFVKTRSHLEEQRIELLPLQL